MSRRRSPHRIDPSVKYLDTIGTSVGHPLSDGFH